MPGIAPWELASSAATLPHDTSVGMEIFADPSKDTLLIVLGVCSLVAVAALPVLL